MGQQVSPSVELEKEHVLVTPDFATHEQVPL